MVGNSLYGKRSVAPPKWERKEFLITFPLALLMNAIRERTQTHSGRSLRMLFLVETINSLHKETNNWERLPCTNKCERNKSQKWSISCAAVIWYAARLALGQRRDENAKNYDERFVLVVVSASIALSFFRRRRRRRRCRLSLCGENIQPWAALISSVADKLG